MNDSDRCGACGRLRELCICDVQAQTEDESMVAELERLDPPAKLRWLASDMELAQRQRAAGQVCSLERVRVWAGTLQAMHRGLMASVERGGGGGVGGNRRQRRAHLTLAKREK